MDSKQRSNRPLGTAKQLLAIPPTFKDFIMTEATTSAVAPITVCKGIVLVVSRTPGLTRTSKYPWDKLKEVGDGFAVPTDINDKGFRTLAQKAGAARGMLFSVGKNPADGNKLYCVLKGFRPVDTKAKAEEAAAEAQHPDAEQAPAAEAPEAEFEQAPEAEAEVSY